jgi:hypothetical protein
MIRSLGSYSVSGSQLWARIELGDPPGLKVSTHLISDSTA